MSKKQPESTEGASIPVPDVDSSQPDCPPPSGGSWRWQGQWVPNIPPEQTAE